MSRIPLPAKHAPQFSPAYHAAGDLVVFVERNSEPATLVTVWREEVTTLALAHAAQDIALAGNTLVVAGLDRVQVMTHGGASGWSTQSFELPEPTQISALAASSELIAVQTFTKDVWVFERTPAGWTRCWSRNVPCIAPALSVQGRLVAISTRVGFPEPRDQHSNRVLFLDFAAGAAQEETLDLPLPMMQDAVVLSGERVVACDSGGGALLLGERSGAWRVRGPLALPSLDDGENLLPSLRRVDERRVVATLESAQGRRLVLLDLDTPDQPGVATPRKLGELMLADATTLVVATPEHLERSSLQS
jgi:hypothetical protein